jgi:hypothetical protein
MLADSWRTILVQCIEHADSICLVHHINDFVRCSPLETRYFIIRCQMATDYPTAEDKGDDPTLHVLVHAGQGDRLNNKASLLANFAANSTMDGLAEFQDATRRLPAEVIAPPDKKCPVLVVNYYACHADRVGGALRTHLITSG